MSAVICYGSLIPDRVLRLPHFPHPGEGVHALSEHLYLGGEPCNVGGHLAAWGEPVIIAGNNLGNDPLGVFVQSRLNSRPNTHVVSRIDAAVQTPTCYIWTTPDGERTIVPSWPTSTGWSLPEDALFQQARIVSASIYGPGMEQMLARARAFELPLAVADVTGPDDPRLPGAAIVTTSRAVLHRRHGVHDINRWIEAVHAASGALVVVSAGAGAVHALTRDGAHLFVKPPGITPVDTTGAGDALKAGLIFGWLREWPIQQTLRWSVAAASLQCLHPGPCEQPATRAQIERVMASIEVQPTLPEGSAR